MRPRAASLEAVMVLYRSLSAVSLLSDQPESVSSVIELGREPYTARGSGISCACARVGAPAAPAPAAAIASTSTPRTTPPPLRRMPRSVVRFRESVERPGWVRRRRCCPAARSSLRCCSAAPSSLRCCPAAPSSLRCCPAAPSSLRCCARLDEAGLVGEHDRLHAVAQIELHQHVRDVRLHGRLADEQAGGDLRVREAAGNQLQHLELACRELGQPRRRLGPPRPGADELLDQPPRDRRREE